MLAEIAERVLGVSYRDHLAKAVFEPAGMDSTHLGWRSEYKNRAVAAKTNMTNPEWRSGDAFSSEVEDTSSWNHNSPYWRDIGSPWGGVHTNTLDIALLMQTLLDGGTGSSGEKVFEPGTVRMMLTNYITALPNLSEPTRLREGWGFGWKIQRTGSGWMYGSAVPAGAFGHFGATGTVTWADPASGVVFVLLTNDSSEEAAVLKACGNIAATALCSD